LTPKGRLQKNVSVYCPTIVVVRQFIYMQFPTPLCWYIPAFNSIIHHPRSGV